MQRPYYYFYNFSGVNINRPYLLPRKTNFCIHELLCNLSHMISLYYFLLPLRLQSTRHLATDLHYLFRSRQSAPLTSPSVEQSRLLLYHLFRVYFHVIHRTYNHLLCSSTFCRTKALSHTHAKTFNNWASHMVMCKRRTSHSACLNFH